jgi:acyl-coenzyme A synthetase/AMP-(fatty) acid ligase
VNPLQLIDLPGDPGAIMVRTADRDWTRAELLRRGAALARRIEAAGAAGGPVIVSLDAGPGFVAALAGCWLAGSRPVLLDPLVRRELDAALEATGARVVIRGAAADDPEVGPRVSTIVPDESRDEPGPCPDVPAEAPVAALFTSGSTGAPTLVPKRAPNLEPEIAFLSVLLGEPRRVATLVPWCHIFGFYNAFLLPLRAAGSCDLRAGISPRALLANALAGELDLVVAVPAIYRVLARLAEQDGGVRLPARCRFVSSGSELAPGLRRRFTELTGRPIIDIYGSTETGAVASRTEDGPWTPAPHVEWRVAESGHLEVRSPCVALPAATDGFYRVGDLVRPEGAGFVLEGRADDVVKVGGRRLSLAGVERALAACPGVDGAVVLCRPVRGEPRLVAWVGGGAAADGERVKAFARGRLADHEVPAMVRVLDALPLNPGGKPDRRLLAALSEKEG